MNLKILIVDDERIKIGKIREALQQTGKIDVEDMEDCMTVDDAIRKIRNCRYDLIILDVLLPYKIDQEVSSAGGTDLLIDLVGKQHIQNDQIIAAIAYFPNGIIHGHAVFHIFHINFPGLLESFPDFSYFDPFIVDNQYFKIHRFLPPLVVL